MLDKIWGLGRFWQASLLLGTIFIFLTLPMDPSDASSAVSCDISSVSMGTSSSTMGSGTVSMVTTSSTPSITGCTSRVSGSGSVSGTPFPITLAQLLKCDLPCTNINIDDYFGLVWFIDRYTSQSAIIQTHIKHARPSTNTNGHNPLVQWDSNFQPICTCKNVSLDHNKSIPLHHSEGVKTLFELPFTCTTLVIIWRT